MRTMGKDTPAERFLVLSIIPVYSSAHWCLLCRKQNMFPGLSGKREAGSSWLSLRPRASLDRLGKNLFITAAFPGLLYEGPNT